MAFRPTGGIRRDVVTGPFYPASLAGLAGLARPSAAANDRDATWGVADQTVADRAEGQGVKAAVTPPAISDVATAFGPLIRRAAAGHVRRVVVLSVMGVNPALPHWRMERMVKAAGLPMTALRPAYFAQNLVTAFGEDIRLHSRLSLASGNGRVSFVDARDIAAVAARVLTDVDACPPGPLTLTGPQALTFGDAAALLTAELSHPVTYERRSLWQRRADLRARGAASTYVNVQLIIDITTRLGLASKVTQDVARILGRPATSLEQFIHDSRAVWAWSRTTSQPEHDRRWLRTSS